MVVVPQELKRLSAAVEPDRVFASIRATIALEIVGPGFDRELNDRHRNETPTPFAGSDVKGMGLSTWCWNGLMGVPA
jgi:hypothetical protein